MSSTPEHSSESSAAPGAVGGGSLPPPGTFASLSSLLSQTQRTPLEEAPFWQEVLAFNQLPSSIINEYYGKFVAVYQGNIVDSDLDEGQLALRFYRTFGYVPVYIHKVGTEDGLIDTDEV